MCINLADRDSRLRGNDGVGRAHSDGVGGADGEEPMLKDARRTRGLVVGAPASQEIAHVFADVVNRDAGQDLQEIAFDAAG